MCVRACVCERRWIGLIKSCVSRASCGDLYLLKSAAVDKLFVKAVQDQKEQRCAVRCCAVLSSLIKQSYTHNSFKRIWRRVKDDKHSSTEKCCCDEGGSGRGWRFLFRSAELSWTIASPFSSFSKLLRLLEANNTDWALSSRLEKRKKKKKKFLQSALRCDNLKNKFLFFFTTLLLQSGKRYTCVSFFFSRFFFSSFQISHDLSKSYSFTFGAITAYCECCCCCLLHQFASHYFFHDDRSISTLEEKVTWQSRSQTKSLQPTSLLYTIPRSL